eukprot:12924853-Heterocapsa_arctica.AAC.1
MPAMRRVSASTIIRAPRFNWSYVPPRYRASVSALSSCATRSLDAIPLSRSHSRSHCRGSPPT